MSKIMVWDLETTDLRGNKGHILTAAAKWVEDNTIYTWSIADADEYGTSPASYLDDQWIVEGLIEMIYKSDALVHHYGDGFDLPFLNTRALNWKIDPAPQIRTIDTWKIARQNLAMTSNRLKSLAAFLNDDEHQKMDNLDISEWALAEHGDEHILKEMLEYNMADVLATEKVYLRLRPLMKNHPHVATPVAGEDPRLQCPACGSYDSESKGSYYTKTMHVKRRRCNECGTPWEESRGKK